MLRRLHADQPSSFAFTPANQAWAEAQMTKFPEGRQASAVIPLLWRAQEQEGWLTRPAIEAVADLLGMAYIRVLEVATVPASARRPDRAFSNMRHHHMYDLRRRGFGLCVQRENCQQTACDFRGWKVQLGRGGVFGRLRQCADGSDW